MSYIRMDREIDLGRADRDTLIAVIVRQQAIIESEVTEQAYIARACPQRQRCGVPTAQIDGVALGQQRLGVNLVSPIAALREEAKAFTHPSAQQRRTAQLGLEQRRLARCRPYLDDPSAPQSRLCRRMDNHIKELSVFVAEPEVPPDNNAAERSLRPVVISRKISGGTRSEQGTQTKMTLASIFGAWRAPGCNTLTACRQMLTSPRP